MKRPTKCPVQWVKTNLHHFEISERWKIKCATDLQRKNSKSYTTNQEPEWLCFGLTSSNNGNWKILEQYL